VVGVEVVESFCFAVRRIRFRSGSACRLRCVEDTLQLLLSLPGGQESGPGFLLTGVLLLLFFHSFCHVPEGGIFAILRDERHSTSVLRIGLDQAS